MDTVWGVLQTTTDEIQVQALWCLANIASESIDYRNELLEKGILDKLQSHLESSSTSDIDKENLAWAVAVMSRQPSPASIYLDQTLTIAMKLYHHEDKLIVAQAMEMLALVLHDSKSRQKVFFEENGYTRLLELLRDSLKNDDTNIQAHGLEMIGDIACIHKRMKDLILETDTVNIIFGVMGLQKSILKPICLRVVNDLLVEDTISELILSHDKFHLILQEVQNSQFAI